MICNTDSPDYLTKNVFFCFYMMAFFLSISISLTQIFLGLTLLFWVLLMVREKKIIFSGTPMGRPVIYYAGALLLSAIFGINTSHSLIALRELWITLIFFSMITLINNLVTIKRLIYALFAGSAIASVYGITQRLMGGLDLFRPAGKKIIQYAYLQQPNEVLSIGFFDHHLTFAEILLFTICLSIPLLVLKCVHIRKDDSANKYLDIGIYSSVVVLNGLSIFYSFARGSWIGFCAGLFFLLIFIKKKTAITIGSVFMILVIMISVFHTPIRNRILSTFNQTDRLYIWLTAINIFYDHPLTGIGVDNWNEGAPPYFKDINDNIHKFNDMAVTQHAHNNFIHHAAVSGIIGLVAFIYIWVVLFTEGLKLYKYLPERQYMVKAIMIGGMSGIVGFQTAGLFEATYNDSEVAMMHWFIAGLIFSAARCSRKR